MTHDPLDATISIRMTKRQLVALREVVLAVLTIRAVMRTLGSLGDREFSELENTLAEARKILDTEAQS